MISFRFHLVSIAAVFLALGLGVLTGTAVLNRGIVAQLERQTDQLAATSAHLREELRRLQSEADVWDRFGTETAGLLLEGRLRGTVAVVVTQEGTDSTAIDRVRRGLEAAGAEVRAVLSLGERFVLTGDADLEELTRIVGSREEDPQTVRLEAAEALAARLVSGGRTGDVLERMITAGFVLNRGPGLGAAGMHEVGELGQVIVGVAGGPGEPAMEPADVLVPLVESLVTLGATVAAAETAETDYPFVGVLRGNPAVSPRVLTQDNVDQVPGEIGLVLGVGNLLRGGEPGHHGVKDGAQSLLPST